MAFTALQSGPLTPTRRFSSNQLDLGSRAKAATAVLDGLKTNEADFAELRGVSQRPYSRYPVMYDVEDPAGILLFHLNPIRSNCRRLQLHASAELAAGQSDNALQDVKLIFRLTDSLEREPFLISYLVRVACIQCAIEPIWEGLAEHRWSDAQLQELEAHLREYNFVADLKWSLDGERAMCLAIIDS